jgi:hypothetical protein
LEQETGLSLPNAGVTGWVNPIRQRFRALKYLDFPCLGVPHSAGPYLAPRNGAMKPLAPASETKNHGK